MVGLTEVLIVSGIVVIVLGVRRFKRFRQRMERTVEAFKKGLTSHDNPNEKDVTPISENTGPDGKKMP